MTLVEVLVAMGIGSLVFVALGSLTLFSARSFRSMIDYSEINKSSRMALDRISKEIRQSRGLNKVTSSALVFNIDPPGSTFTVQYDKTGKTLTLLKNGATNFPTFGDCAHFGWQLFQQTTPPAGQSEFVATADLALCKMIQLDWTFSKDILQITNSDSVQSMKIVIRKPI